ncbi:MAG: hypothetical protein II581_05865, partial [Oscillospiraceae bacterium]|nr:hypothetical protein [Oscillospiraceae bacterium]
MEPELQEFRSGKKSLELICYIAGAGAFGVFLRWMQLQLAFNELGLAEKSSFHAVLILFVVAAGVVFFRFVRGFEKARLYLPDSFSEAFSNPGRFYRIARIAAGLIVCAGSVLLYVQTGEDKHSGDYLVLSVLGLLSGIAFPLWLSRADGGQETAPWLLCVLSFVPMLFLAAWMVVCYKLNTINSVIWSFGPELFAIGFTMFAFFRLGGWAFGRPKWQLCLFFCMLSASLCILNLADKRVLGLQIIFLGLAAELILCCWIMVANLQKGEAPPKKKTNTGGFETL